MMPRIALTIAFGLALIEPALCPAASYTITGLGTDGGTSSAAYGISDNGLVTGSISFGQQLPADAFLYDGAMQDLGAGSGVGYGVNDAGEVTGATNDHGFLYNGAMHDLGTGMGRGINNNGVVVFDSNSAGYLYDGSFHPLPFIPGGQLDAIGLAINSSAQVVGFGDAPIGDVIPGGVDHHAYFYDGTNAHDLGTSGESFPDAVPYLSAAYGINNKGDVVGVDDALRINSAYFTGGFLYSGGVKHAI